MAIYTRTQNCCKQSLWCQSLVLKTRLVEGNDCWNKQCSLHFKLNRIVGHYFKYGIKSNRVVFTAFKRQNIVGYKHKHLRKVNW